VDLDPSDPQMALDQAESQLAQTVREVRTLYTGNDVLDAQIALRNTEWQTAQTELARAQARLAAPQELGAGRRVGARSSSMRNSGR
jgi:membrane fusion protein (multidrug efflux system)